MNVKHLLAPVVAGILLMCGEAEGGRRVFHRRCCVQTGEYTNKDLSNPTVMAEKAKAALVKLIRARRRLFEGDPNPDVLEKLPLKNDVPDHYWLGAFSINVKLRKYSAQVHFGSSWWFYNGAFTVNGHGDWTAQEPESIHAQEPLGNAGNRDQP